jgi:sugar phosphate isomerase/epimerase
MILSGFTDEAADGLAGQIKATKELGWTHLSARTFNGQNIHELSDKDFELVCNQLEANDIKVAEFGTLIGNWGKSINSDWHITLGEIERCIPRMQRLGVRYARVMSYAQVPWDEEQYEEERFRRLREITQRFEAAGLMALHENCMNWGGFSADHTLRLLEEVPGLRLVFDTGNPIFQRDRSKPEPHPWQDPLEFYHKVKHAIAHVHIKDAVMKADAGEPEYTFAGEGDAQVEAILEDLIRSGYTGMIAIEPHIGKVFHLAEDVVDENRAYDLYVEYGRKFEKLVQGVQKRVKGD